MKQVIISNKKVPTDTAANVVDAINRHLFDGVRKNVGIESKGGERWLIVGVDSDKYLCVNQYFQHQKNRTLREGDTVLFLGDAKEAGKWLLNL